MWPNIPCTGERATSGVVSITATARAPGERVVRFHLIPLMLNSLKKISKQIALLILLGVLAKAQHLLNPQIPLIENPGSRPAVKVLQKQTRAKLSIPKTLPKSYADRAEFYCTITKLKRYEYEMIIGSSTECGGGNACRLGSLYGKRTKHKSITGTADYPFAYKTAKRVKLKKGITGYFVDATCGANCSDSKIFWKIDGWENMVGLKVGKIAQVIQLANSAITGTSP